MVGAALQARRRPAPDFDAHLRAIPASPVANPRRLAWVRASTQRRRDTLLGIQIATVRNSKTADFGLDANNAGPDGPQTNGGYNENPIPGHSQSSVYAGIQHVF